MEIKTAIAITLLAFANLAAAESVEMVLISHRGEPFRIPQNTAESIKLAYELGAKTAECDFHATSEGELVCGHDDKRFAKMSGVNKRMRDLTRAEIPKINMANSDEWRGKFDFIKLSTVDEILSVVPEDGVLECEIKHYSPEYADIFDAARKKAGLKIWQTRIIAFDNAHFENLKDFNKKYPEYDMLLIFSYDPKTKTPTAETMISRAKELGAKYVSLGKYWNVDREFIKKIQDAGLKINNWLVQDVNDLATVAKLKPNTITSDHARKLRDDLEKLKQITLK